MEKQCSVHLREAWGSAGHGRPNSFKCSDSWLLNVKERIRVEVFDMKSLIKENIWSECRG